MKQDKHGILLPGESVKNPLTGELISKNPENTTRIYTTKDYKKMDKVDVLQCISMYETDFKTKPKTIIIPYNQVEHKEELTKLGLEVKVLDIRAWSIQLSQV